MELIDQSHKIWGISPSTYDEAMLWIERAARNCYASQDKIKPGSAEKLIDGIMKSDPPHSSVLEHISIYAENDYFPAARESLAKILDSKWLYKTNGDDALEVYGNLRAWMECLKVKRPIDVFTWLGSNDFSIVNNTYVPTKAAKRITVELTTDRAVLAEITRHRADVAFSVESQRYVNYDDGITFIKPSWWDASPTQQHLFKMACSNSEEAYRRLRSNNIPPQHARTVLNQQVKTTIVMSAYLPEWEWIFKLRTGPGAYPQMVNLMQLVEAEFKERGWV